MSKLACKSTKQRNKGGRAHGGDGNKRGHRNAKNVSLKRRRKPRGRKSTSYQAIESAAQPVLPVIFVSLEKTERSARGQFDDMPRTNVPVPPPIVVPLDKVTKVVPPPIVVPLDKFRRQTRRRRRQKSAGSKPEVPPPIYVTPEKIQQAQRNRKKNTSPEVMMPPPIFVSLDGIGRSRSKRM